MIEKLILHRRVSSKAPTRQHDYEVYHKTPRFGWEEPSRVSCEDDTVETYVPGNNTVAGVRTCDLGLGPDEFALYQVCYKENDPRFRRDRDEDWFEVDLSGNCLSGICNAFAVDSEDCQAGGYDLCSECGQEYERDDEDHDQCPFCHCEESLSIDWPGFEWKVWVKKISPTHRWPRTLDELKQVMTPLADPNQEEMGL